MFLYPSLKSQHVVISYFSEWAGYGSELSGELPVGGMYRNCVMSNVAKRLLILFKLVSTITCGLENKSDWSGIGKSFLTLCKRCFKIGALLCGYSKCYL